MRNGIKAGAKGQNSKMLIAMAQAHQKMQKAPPQQQQQALKAGLGSVLGHLAQTRSMGMQARPGQAVQRPQQATPPAAAPAPVPAAQQPAAAPQQPAQGQPTAQGQQPQRPKKTITVDDKFYDGQPVHALDANGQPSLAGRIKLADEARSKQDGIDYVVVDDKGNEIGHEKSHPWEAVDPSQSPSQSPPKKAKIISPPSQTLNQAMANAKPVTPPGQQAAAPAQPPTNQNQTMIVPQQPGGPINKQAPKQIATSPLVAPTNPVTKPAPSLGKGRKVFKGTQP